jgi:exopolysaccharide biosynthesis operon protein EpsL
LITSHIKQAAALLVFALFYSSCAKADAGDTFNVTARYSLLETDNLFLLSRDADLNRLPGGATSKSETIKTSVAELSLDKSYSLQRFQINASINDYRYQNFSYLSYTAMNYAAGWQWAFTPRVRGTLTASRREVSNNFTDVTDISVRNIRTDKLIRFDGEADLGAAWRITTRLDQADSTNEVPVVREADSVIKSGSLGTRYVFPSGNFIGLNARYGSGEYLNRVTTVGGFLPRSFDETEHDIRSSWRLGGKTNLIGRIGYFQRRHQEFDQRDFGGVVGDIRATWRATGKTTMVATLSRTFNAYQTELNSYAAGNKLSLVPEWQATAHTSLRVNYEYFLQNYGGGLTSEGLAARRDTTRSATISLDWHPRPTISLILSLQNQKRISNLAGFDYKANSASVAGQITF